MTSASGDQTGLSVGGRIWQGVIGGAVYRRIAEEPRGAYAAFLLVAGVTAAMVAFAVALSLSRGLTAIGAAWSQLPDFTISGGTLALPAGVSAPVRVASGRTVILLENGTPSGGALGGASPGLLLTGSELVLRTGSGSTGERIIPLSALGATTLTKASLGSVLRELSGTWVWVGALLSVVYSLLRDVVRAAVIGWIGLLSVRMVGRDPGWPQAWRVGMAAWTLPMLTEVVQIAVPFPGWALWVVACVYGVTGCFYLTPL